MRLGAAIAATSSVTRCTRLLAALGLLGLLFLALLLPWRTAQAAQPLVLRVAALPYGSLAWELDVMQRHGLAQRHGLRLEQLPVASPQAALLALQSSAADIILSDWLWVAQQRRAGRGYTFAPYSLAVGGIMVAADSPLHTLADLRGRHLGIAGGAEDKSWRLLQAYARQRYGLDLAREARIDYAAPPALSQLLQRGRLDAALNHWHYNARLRALGLRPLADVDEALRGLGIERPLALLGWVFDERWARQQPAALAAFLAASQDARALMRDRDAEWQRLRPLLQAPDQATLVALREAWRAGLPPPQLRARLADAQRLYAVLEPQGGDLPPQLFWNAEAAP